MEKGDESGNDVGERSASPSPKMVNIILELLGTPAGRKAYSIYRRAEIKKMVLPILKNSLAITFFSQGGPLFWRHMEESHEPEYIKDYDTSFDGNEEKWRKDLPSMYRRDEYYYFFDKSVEELRPKFPHIEPSDLSLIKKNNVNTDHVFMIFGEPEMAKEHYGSLVWFRCMP